MTNPNQALRATVVDHVVQLLELDYSRLLGNAPGTNVQRFAPHTDTEGHAVALGGVEYPPIPVELRGFQRRIEGSQPRPAVQMANGHGFMSQLIEEVGDLVGATLLRKRIFARHLDGGDDPDPSQVWEPVEEWIVERKSQENYLRIEWELSAPVDVEQFDLPAGRIEPNLCRWLYKSVECGWVPGAGPYFDRNGASVAEPQDECGLRSEDCRLRFQARNEPLRFGGFPSAGRIVR